MPPAPDAPAADSIDAAPALKTVEAWCVAKNTPDWLYAGARNASGWALGRELPEADYDAAIEKARGATMLPSEPPKKSEG